MSVTVRDLLKLPCLREARVCAGTGGLGNIVSSVSVLEYAHPGPLLERLYDSKEWSGGELVISGFINVKDDVEAQCLNVRRMADVGEVGLVLYYVGVFLPSVPTALAAVCDELDFPLIVMPEHRLNLRYSEVICEVMEVIFKDQQSSTYLVGDILDRVALLPEHQRSLDTVLKMLSDQTRASAVLTDGALRLLNAAAWPRTLGLDLERALQSADALPEAGGAPKELAGLGQTFRLYRCPLTEAAPTMELFLLKEGEALAAETVRQAGELVRLAANIWSRGHAEVVVSELVRAILKDEPIKMRRLADIFHIDVSAIHTMWVVRGAQEGREEFSQKAPALAREVLAHRCKTVVADLYEGDLVAFMDFPASAGDGGDLAGALVRQLGEAGLSCSLTLCRELPDTRAVRRAYLTIRESRADGDKIWPGRDWYTLQEVEFAGACRRTVEAGEAALQAALSPLAPLDAEREGGELRRTLAVYLLDAEQSVARTAERLFLHKNTVKYRLQRIAQRLGHRADKLPETFGLYRACALERLMGG